MAPNEPTEVRDRRAGFLESARDRTQYLGVEANGATFVVNASETHMGRHLFLKQARPEFRVLRRAVGAVEALTGDDAVAGRLFVDVGANIGTSTISALASQRFGSAVCCEPQEENHRLLRVNLALNGLEERAKPLRVAASDRVGQSNLMVVGAPAWKSRLALDEQMIEDKRADLARRRLDDPAAEVPELSVSDVELVTLDQLTEQGTIDADSVGMVWIDAEGHEGHVLAGARRLLDCGVPVCLEFHPDGLEKHGGRGKLEDLAKQCYTHFVDVRRQERDRQRFGLRPIEELRQLADRFLDPTTPGAYTDVLLLRLDPKQASAAGDLPALVRKRRARAK